MRCVGGCVVRGCQILWGPAQPHRRGWSRLDGLPPGRIAAADHGNLLEAVNLSLNVFDRHHVDRVFQRSGLGILVISPTGGVYEVSVCLSTVRAQLGLGLSKAPTQSHRDRGKERETVSGMQEGTIGTRCSAMGL
jgi:hypothetical protein